MSSLLAYVMNDPLTSHLGDYVPTSVFFLILRLGTIFLSSSEHVAVFILSFLVLLISSILVQLIPSVMVLLVSSVFMLLIPSMFELSLSLLVLLISSMFELSSSSSSSSRESLVCFLCFPNIYLNRNIVKRGKK
jgi:hypothetical protein